MPLLSFLQSISTWAPIVFIRDSKYGMPTVQSFHLMGLTILLATILLLDLRLAGARIVDLPVSDLAGHLKPWTRGAAALSILSGILIFLATPGKYLGSNPFRVKMALLCLAIVLQFGVLRGFLRTDAAPRPRWINLSVALLSLTLWFCVGWAGRAIAFVP